MTEQDVSTLTIAPAPRYALVWVSVLQVTFGSAVKAKEFFAVIIGCIGLILFSSTISGEVIKIGLRANQGAELAIKRWQPTADYLSKTIPDHTFILVPFEINGLLNQAVSRSEFDFVFTNSASYVEQKMRYGVSAIATLINKREGKAYSQFGSVVLARADRNDITSFRDLKGKRFMGVDELGFGGWRMAYRELLGKGVDPYKDFRLLSFGGGIQQNVVFAVRDGAVDAGSVRTGMLERMAQRGEIQLETFKVLEPKRTERFDFYHSSRLYPEWPFAKLAHTSDDLANQVATALYKLMPESEAAKQGRYMGWAVPLDYEPVNELLKELGAGPYAVTGGVTWGKLTKGYWKEGLIALIVFLTTVVIVCWVTLSNMRLRRITSELEMYRKHLEEKVSERTAALHKTTVRLQTLFDAATEFIFVIDLEGRIKQANRYVFERTGYTEKDVTGHSIKEFLTPDSQDACDCNFPGLREHCFNRADIEFVCNDGSSINMECSATAVPDEHGDFTTFLIILRDISERLRVARRLEESERRFRAIFNSTYQFIGLLDPEGTTLETNQTALDFIGLTNADVVGKPFWETPWWTHSPQLQKRLKDGIMEAAHGKLVRFEAEHTSKEGQTAVIDFSLKPILNEQGETVLIIPEGRDITERKHAEEEAQRMQQESAHVMRLSTMGEMASGMAHELNQPLTALVSYCGTAMKLARDMPSLPEGYIDILERASGQAHRAGNIIRHLREFVSKGSNNKTRVVLDDLIQGVIDFISWERRDSDIQVTFLPGSLAREVFVDKVQIEQVLINLIRNSIEAITNAGISDGQVDIATRLAAEGSVEVTVADNGPGIDPAVAGSLFEPYQTSKEDGMGMGLSISRSIIEAHNGKLWADEKRPQGALFCMSIPGCD